MLPGQQELQLLQACSCLFECGELKQTPWEVYTLDCSFDIMLIQSMSLHKYGVFLCWRRLNKH